MKKLALVLSMVVMLGFPLCSQGDEHGYGKNLFAFTFGVVDYIYVKFADDMITNRAGRYKAVGYIGALSTLAGINLTAIAVYNKLFN